MTTKPQSHQSQKQGAGVTQEGKVQNEAHKEKAAFASILKTLKDDGGMKRGVGWLTTFAACRDAFDEEASIEGIIANARNRKGAFQGTESVPEGLEGEQRMSNREEGVKAASSCWGVSM